MIRSKWFWLAFILIGAILLGFHPAHRGVVILHYHSVNYAQGRESLIAVTPEDFAWHLAYLEKAGYNVVTLAQAVAYLEGEKKLPPKAVAITFDDGYQDNYTLALPLLKKRGFPATVFMVTGEIGGVNSWDIPKGYPSLNLLDWEEIALLEERGVSVMPHSVHHLNLTKLPPAEALGELVESKAVLEERLGGERPYFAYPYGSLNQKVVDTVQTAGYKGAFTSSPGTNVFGKTDIYRIRRMPIKEEHQGFWGHLLFALALKLNSLYPV